MVLAAVLLGDTLGAAQLAGAALVIGAALLLQLGGRISWARDAPAPPAAPAPAGSLA